MEKHTQKSTFNTKKILREELLFTNTKKLLNKQSLSLINNHNHIKFVLGINIPLNENISLETRKLIIEAQFGLEKMLSSITNYVGSAVEKGKEKIITAIEDISSLKDIALLIKDLIVSPELMKTALNKLKDVGNGIIDELKNKTTTIIGVISKSAPNLIEKIKKLIEHIIEVLSKLISGEGWVAFLKILGFSCLIKFLTKGVFDKFKNLSGGEVKTYFNGMVDIMNKFKEFSISIIEKLDIRPIIDWFTKIGVGSVLSPILNSINIIIILNEVLKPVIESVDWDKNLSKNK